MQNVSLNIIDQLDMHSVPLAHLQQRPRNLVVVSQHFSDSTISHISSGHLSSCCQLKVTGQSWSSAGPITLRTRYYRYNSEIYKYQEIEWVTNVKKRPITLHTKS